ncbi:MAG: aspartate aminotransferase family protein, partial [Vampirovibrionia bacterium]
MNLAQLKELDDKYILNTYKRYPLQVVRGEGVNVYDENGNKYLDFLGGIAVNALGYAHPAVLNAINNQAKELIHISNLFYTQPQVDLAQKLCEISGMDKVFFSNSGAEANELAIKLARLNSNKSGGKKNNFVCMKHSFHGRTMASLTVTKGVEYSEKFKPMLETPVFVEFNNCDALKSAVNEQTACIILEPIQGEGGINMADKEFLVLARQLADQHEALLVMDEVQSGLGRTGDYFAHQFSGIKPDVITVAKPIASGLPMGAVLMNEKAASLFAYGYHGSTFGCNCLASDVALAFLKTIEIDNLLENVVNVGNYFIESLSNLKDKYSFIKSVRGKGCIVGLELEKPMSDLHLKLISEGLICNCTSDVVIRFLPPYIITKS